VICRVFSLCRSRLTYVRSGFLQLTLDLASFLSVLIGVLCGLHLRDVVLNLRDVGLALHDVIGIPPDVFDFRLFFREGHDRREL
jgi:hypothetical protein